MRAKLCAMILAASGLLQAGPDAPPLAVLRDTLPEAARTQVMVLGTFHFREIEADFRPAMVEPLLRRLESFKPDVVAVETLPGSHIHELELRAAATSIHGLLLDRLADSTLALGHEAQALLKLDVIGASKSLAAQEGIPGEPSALVALALQQLAAYEWPSALLTWSRIPADSPARAGVPAALAAKLDAQLVRVSEIQRVAIPLARKLGHARIACVDEFEALEPLERVVAGLDAAHKEAPLLAEAGKAAVYRRNRECRDAAVAAGDLLPFFRRLNAPATQAADVDAQWAVFLRTHLENGADRGRLALWENRNLKIAGRIRALSALYPGKRILVIYGAAHKPFLDAVLGTCGDLLVVQPRCLEPAG